MTPKDLRNIHTTRNSCKDVLPCKWQFANHNSCKQSQKWSTKSKSHTNHKNQALLRKEIIKELPDLSVFLDFPAKLMGNKRHSRENINY